MYLGYSLIVHGQSFLHGEFNRAERECESLIVIEIKDRQEDCGGKGREDLLGNEN